ncbi:MAG: hypothetical protein IKO39_09725 [Treponema sp.]|nr:hypothetical protein [Treponema sp.]
MPNSFDIFSFSVVSSSSISFSSILVKSIGKFPSYAGLDAALYSGVSVGGAYRLPCGSRSGFPHFRYRFIAPLRSATPDGGATIPKPRKNNENC